MTKLRDDGQPVCVYYNARRVSDRKVDELIGLCRGVLSDGVATVEEARYLVQWIEANRAYRDQWPIRVLYARLEAMLADNRLDVKEQGDLLDLLMHMTGARLPSLDEEAASLSTTLPLDSLPPDICFEDRRFCLTGKFVSGTRNECEGFLITRGAIAQKSPTRETHYLVIGVLGSRDWVHSTHGRKIEKAVKLRDVNRTGLVIVTEEHWAKSIRRG